ncbi:mas-related G-protein coupled receptor member A4-like [Sander lucioperca]|uniref:mas-related G-protein coupled receptor member A4-like n=1 Tax=Sander lucioperca TaxID=283035 RepID=UPI00165350E7|nr:mas-related G-protein coupled receptor member A4-like [Sander lucioperca]
MDVNNTTQDNNIFTSTISEDDLTTIPIPTSTYPAETNIPPFGIAIPFNPQPQSIDRPQGNPSSDIYNSIFISGSHNLTNSTFGSSNYTNSTFSYHDDTKALFITDVVTCIIICIGLPLTFVAIYSLYSLVRNDHVVPIYIINLLISDLIQLCCMICDVVQPDSPIIFIIYYSIYNYSLMTSVGFMVCIAMERYLLIVFPLWYHCRRTIKSTVVICVVAWALPALYVFTVFFGGNFNVPQIIAVVFLFLPFPLLIFFCCATLKALSASVSILPEEKRRIVGTLVLVLLIYMLLFLPDIILIMVVRYIKDQSQTNALFSLSSVFLKLNPLADLVLYIFMKKGALDKILVSVCCCRVEDVSSLENNTNGEN